MTRLSDKNVPGASQKNYYTCCANAEQLQDLNARGLLGRISTMSFGDHVEYTAKRTKQDSAKQTADKTRRREIDGRQHKTDKTNPHSPETPASDASNASEVQD